MCTSKRICHPEIIGFGKQLFSDIESECYYFSKYLKNSDKRARNLMSLSQQYNESCLSFKLDVGKGILTLLLPVKNSKGHIIHDQNGVLHFMVEFFNIFTVSGYNNNKNLCYICVESKSIELYDYGNVNPNMADF